MTLRRNRKKKVIYRLSNLGSIVSNIVARQDFPRGCDISFEKKDRKIRSDKIISWASFGKLKDDLNVSYLLTKIGKRTKKFDFNKAHLIAPDGKRIAGNTLLRTVRSMEGIPTWEEIEIAEKENANMVVTQHRLWYNTLLN